MTDRTLTEPITLDIGAMSRSRLLEALAAANVGLNGSANTLLDNAVFDQSARQTVTVVERSVSEIGVPDEAVLPKIFEVAQEQGLHLCPPTLGPYLRLAVRSQLVAPDSVTSNGRAPSGSLTIASAPLRPDAEYPNGFYLRVIDGRPWLRGYRCTDQYVWDPDDRFVFCTHPAA